MEVVRLWIEVRGYHLGFIYHQAAMLLKVTTDETSPGLLQLAAILETAAYIHSVSFMSIDCRDNSEEQVEEGRSCLIDEGI